MSTTTDPIESLPITESDLPGLPYKKAVMQMADFRQHADKVYRYVLAGGVILLVEDAHGNSTMLTSAATYELFRELGLTDNVESASK